MSGTGDDPKQGPPSANGPAEQDDDRTQFMPMPSPDPDAAPHDDRTRLAGQAPAQADDADDNDRTRLGIPVAPPAPVSEPVPDPAADAAIVPPPLAQPGHPAIARSAGLVQVGTLINNNYEITQVLKSGGMGEVYRGVEIGTGDPVAIKAILPELAEDEKAGLLFKREARTLRQLADEAIVRYYNYVHDRALDRYFLVMEYIEGVPLSDFIVKNGAITPAAARTLLRRLARGLAKAHAQDVVHRDLSPDNVMLPDGLVAEARLIDFGIAKSSVVTEGTMAGQFAGKFKYVAPEQLGHYNGDIGPATDIYGLALLICAAVQGRPLDMGTSIVEAVQSRMRIPDLSALPAEMRPILSYMLEPDPARRPASMDDVQRLLERPEMIPLQYRSGLPLPPAMEVTQRNTTQTGAFQTTGVFNTAAPGQTAGGYQLTPGLQLPGTVAPVTMRGAALPPVPEAPVEKDKTGSRALALLVAGFVAILGGAGWYAWTEGLIGAGGASLSSGTGAGTGPETSTGTGADSAAGSGAGGLLPVQITSREGFLATFDAGPCTYAARVGSGAYAGMIETFATGGTPFDALPAAYAEQFGASAALQPREVTAAQCPALELARALQGRSGAAVQMLLSADVLTSGETVDARITAPDDAALWTVLISPQGAVFNLTGRLSEGQGGQRDLAFGLTLTRGSEAAPHLLLTVASDSPLVRAAAMRDGSAAADVLPAVLDEVRSRSRDASASLAWVLLSPEPETPGQSSDETDPSGQDGVTTDSD